MNATPSRSPGAQVLGLVFWLVLAYITAAIGAIEPSEHDTGTRAIGRARGELELALGLELARLVADPGVGGVDPVNVGIDLALVCFQRRRHRDGRGIGAAASQRGDAAVLIDALETGDHDDPALRHYRWLTNFSQAPREEYLSNDLVDRFNVNDPAGDMVGGR